MFGWDEFVICCIQLLINDATQQYRDGGWVAGGSRSTGLVMLPGMR